MNAENPSGDNSIGPEENGPEENGPEGNGPDGSSDMVPRFPQQGFAPNHVDQRRRWVEERTGATLTQVGTFSLDSQQMRGNIENPIGAVQMPLGVAGPLLIHGEHAQGTFYVPLATTEGALVRSYERGMLAITRAGGAVARVTMNENRGSPIFTCQDVQRAYELTQFVQENLTSIRAQAESTTGHGKLLRVTSRLIGRDVVLDFCYHTGDAHGMNMISKATDAACRWIMEHFPADSFYVLSGGSSEKRASGMLFAGGKGKYVTAGVRLPSRITKTYFGASPQQLHNMWQRTILAETSIGTIGYNGHFANGLTALFIACGQDVANVTNSAVGVTSFDITEAGDLYASVTLPSLTVATVGGGTAGGTSSECLHILGCQGDAMAVKLAEIVVATVLAGELSFGAALATSEFVNAHERYGRNRPKHPNDQ